MSRAHAFVIEVVASRSPTRTANLQPCSGGGGGGERPGVAWDATGSSEGVVWCLLPAVAFVRRTRSNVLAGQWVSV